MTVTSTLTVPNVTPTVTIIAPAAGTSVPAGAGLNFGAQISDAGTNDTHSCFINWGDDTESEGHVVDGICSSGHVYTTYGSHAVNAFVVDDDGESAGASVTITVTDDLLKVTGDGTIDGNTSFSLSARGSGALNTSGQLQLRTGRNRFDGNTVDFILLNSPNSVSWSGSGRFNGQGGYTFKATVVDNSTGSGTTSRPTRSASSSGAAAALSSSLPTAPSAQERQHRRSRLITESYNSGSARELAGLPAGLRAPSEFQLDWWSSSPAAARRFRVGGALMRIGGTAVARCGKGSRLRAVTGR